MNHQEQITLISEQNLSPDEQKKRAGLASRKPYIAKKLANIKNMEDNGEISPIIRLEKSYLCNFQCTHCSAEYYMDRHLEKVLKTKATIVGINNRDLKTFNVDLGVTERLKKNIPSDKIVIWGRSLGTGPSCYLAKKQKTAGLLLESPFISTFLTVTEYPLVPWDRFRNLERAPHIQSPSLVIHGHKDVVILFRHGKKFFNALPEPKKLLEFENAGHNDLPEIGGSRYRQEINDFLKSVLEG